MEEEFIQNQERLKPQEEKNIVSSIFHVKWLSVLSLHTNYL